MRKNKRDLMMDKSRIIFILILVPVLTFPLAGCHTAANSQRKEALSEIKIYFNDPLAGLPHMQNLEAQANGLDQALIELINSASRTIDAAVHSITHKEIIAALGQACKRGVKVRLITEADYYQPEQLKSFPTCIALKTDKNEDLMHNKFLVIDKKVVWTGSVNFTDNDIYFNANNAVKLSNAAIASAYIHEFEQLWNDKYGWDKRDNNEEEFNVGGITVEAYFAPSDFPEMIIIDEIRKAQTSIYIAMFYYTNDLIHKALIDALERGVRIRALWDFRGWENFADSEMDEMLALGIGVVDANPGLVHHKFAVIDEKIIITGSANWSNSGMRYNDENILIIEDPATALLFIENFNRLYQDALNYDSDSDNTQPPRVTIKHHNTQDVLARIEWRPHLQNKVDFYEICRATTSMGPCERIFTNIPNNYRYYIDHSAEVGKTYWYRIRGNTGGRSGDWSNEYRIQVEETPCPPSGAKEECDCDDGLSNDDDRYIDCQDYDCATSTACLGPEWQVNQDNRFIPGFISAKEAEERLAGSLKYLGKIVTVRFKVISTYDSGKVIFLNSSEDYKTDFTAVIFKEDEEAFQRLGIEPVSYYLGKTIEVTGELREYNGPEIILHGPWQIREVK